VGAQVQQDLHLGWRQTVGAADLGNGRVERPADDRQQTHAGLDERFVVSSDA
jgi:hypothetical protein